MLVACSGGPDSAALLAVLGDLAPELRLSVTAASIDHGLRDTAKDDVALARAQAAHVGVPFHALQVVVSADRASLQAQARAARYQALGTLAQELGATRIAVGHTRDDQAETVLQRMLRGAAVHGLGAIEPLRADGVVRPLIDAPRAEVHAFAQARFAALAHDPSNLDPRYGRVRVRCELLPALERESPELVLHLAELADDAREHAAFVDVEARRLLARARLDAESVTIPVLVAAAPVLLRAALRAFLAEHGQPAGRSHLRDLETACRSGRGEVWVDARLALRVENATVLRVCVRDDVERG